MNFFRLIPLANFHHLNRGPEESPSMGSLHLDVFTQPRPVADVSQVPAHLQGTGFGANLNRDLGSPGSSGNAVWDAHMEPPSRRNSAPGPLAATSR